VTVMTERPRAVSPGEAGAQRMGGWIAPGGRFYPAAHYEHIGVAAALRANGGGPCEPWGMRDGWVLVKTHGEVLALPGRMTQPQLDTLGDMLEAAPEGRHRSALLASLRQLRDMEM